jgi:OOP family OmpA-OmpF porin
MVKRVILVTVVAALLCPLTTMASMYVGASVGNTWQSAEVTVDDVTNEVQNIDENSTGYKVFGGFSSEGIFGIEGGYRDLGDIESSIEGHELKFGTSGWDVELMAHLPISVIDLFAKAGAFFWSGDSTVGNFSESESGTDFIWGLGAGVSLGPIGIRLEWESMVVSEFDNLSMLSLGATFGF